MLMEIKTDLGTFGDFRDIETFMRLEGHDKVKVICIKVIFKTLDGFVGEYTYNISIHAPVKGATARYCAKLITTN